MQSVFEAAGDNDGLRRPVRQEAVHGLLVSDDVTVVVPQL